MSLWFLVKTINLDHYFEKLAFDSWTLHDLESCSRIDCNTIGKSNSSFVDDSSGRLIGKIESRREERRSVRVMFAPEHRQFGLWYMGVSFKGGTPPHITPSPPKKRDRSIPMRCVYCFRQNSIKTESPNLYGYLQESMRHVFESGAFTKWSFMCRCSCTRTFRHHSSGASRWECYVFAAASFGHTLGGLSFLRVPPFRLVLGTPKIGVGDR